MIEQKCLRPLPHPLNHVLLLCARTYKLVNDVNNVNPFPASFLNGSTRIRLRPITMSGHVLVEIRGRFNTEQSMVTGMRETWQKIYEAMITGLQHSLASGKLLEASPATPQVMPCHFEVRAPPISSHQSHTCCLSMWDCHSLLLEVHSFMTTLDDSTYT